MTEVYLDDARLDYSDTEGDSTVKDLVDAIGGALKGARVIFSVTIDGVMVEDWRAPAISRALISAYREVRFFTATPQELALEGVTLVEEYITDTIGRINSIIYGLRVGSFDDIVQIKVIQDSIAEITRTMDALARGGAKDGISIFKSSPTPYFKRLFDVMTGVSEASKSLDTVLVADVLEYEALPLLAEIRVNVFNVVKI